MVSLGMRSGSDARIAIGRAASARTAHPGLTTAVAIAEMLIIYTSGHFCSWVMSTYTYRKTIVDSDFHAMMIALCALSYPLFAHALGAYYQDHLRNLWRRISRAWMAWCSVLLMMLVLLVVFKFSEKMSRGWLLMWLPTAALMLAILHFCFWQLLRMARQAGIGIRRVVLIGDPGHAQHLVRELAQSRHDDIMVVGRFGPEGADGDLSLLGQADEAPRYLYGQLEGAVDEAWVLQSGAVLGLLDELFYSESMALCQVRFVPDLRGFSVAKDAVDSIGSHVLIGLGIRPYRGLEGWLKSVFDRVGAFVGLLVLSPVLLVIALVTWAGSRGPVLFKQQRHGLHGAEFTIYKFRTLKYTDGTYTTEDGKLDQVKANDPRFTEVGKFLRRWSLDELPQLFNVLKGDMSLVGPRPHEVSMNVDAAREDLDYRLRHRVLPGMTGWAQINGSRGAIYDNAQLKRRLELDLWYIDNWSLLLDLDILVRTMVLGFFKIRGL